MRRAGRVYTIWSVTHAYFMPIPEATDLLRFHQLLHQY